MGVYIKGGETLGVVSIRPCHLLQPPYLLVDERLQQAST